MDSRADGALGRVVLQNRGQLIAEYERYGAKDPLCCPSGATSVVFEIASDTSVLKPVSASDSRGTRVAASPPPPAAKAADSQAIEGKYWQAIELSGRSLQQGTRKPYLQFQPGGRVSGSDGCNQITGHYELEGDRLTFGQMASTQMACVNGPDTERPFREALKSATRLTASGDRLELFDSTGNSLAAFRAGSQGSEPAASPGLAGTSWRLVEFQGSDDTKLTPGDPAKYTIHFDAGGQLAARIDCNRGRGAWNSSGPNQIEFGPLALTRAKCPPGSLHDQIVKQWGNVRSYVIKDGHLFLALMADGGVLEFEPLSQTK